MLWQSAASNPPYLHLCKKAHFRKNLGYFERACGFISVSVSPARQLTWTRANWAPQMSVPLTTSCLCAIPQGLHLPAGDTSDICQGQQCPKTSTFPVIASNAASPRGVQVTTATLQREGQGGGGLGLSCHLCPTGPSAGSTNWCSSVGSAVGPDPPPHLPRGSGGAALLQHPGLSHLYQQLVPPPLHPGRQYCPQPLTSPLFSFHCPIPGQS